MCSFLLAHSVLHWMWSFTSIFLHMTGTKYLSLKLLVKVQGAKHFIENPSWVSFSFSKGFVSNLLLLCPSCCVNLEGEETRHFSLLFSLTPVSKISDLLNLGPPYLLTDKAQWLGQKLNSSLPTGSLWFITLLLFREDVPARSNAKKQLFATRVSVGFVVLSTLHFLTVPLGIHLMADDLHSTCLSWRNFLQLHCLPLLEELPYTGRVRRGSCECCPSAFRVVNVLLLPWA